MAGLADQLLSPGTINTLEAVAPWRLKDAGVLEQQGRAGAAIYLFGFVAEIRLCAACYRVFGYDPTEPIDRNKREALEKEARKLHLMSDQPHDLRGWAWYLVYLRKDRRRGYPRPLSDRIITEAEGLYGHWRPNLRYRALSPTRPQFRVVKQAALWVDENYPLFWN